MEPPPAAKRSLSGISGLDGMPPVRGHSTRPRSSKPTPACASNPGQAAKASGSTSRAKASTQRRQVTPRPARRRRVYSASGTERACEAHLLPGSYHPESAGAHHPGGGGLVPVALEEPAPIELYPSTAEAFDLASARTPVGVMAKSSFNERVRQFRERLRAELINDRPQAAHAPPSNIRSTIALPQSPSMGVRVTFQILFPEARILGP